MYYSRTYKKNRIFWREIETSQTSKNNGAMLIVFLYNKIFESSELVVPIRRGRRRYEYVDLGAKLNLLNYTFFHAPALDAIRK